MQNPETSARTIQLTLVNVAPALHLAVRPFILLFVASSTTSFSLFCIVYETAEYLPEDALRSQKLYSNQYVPIQKPATRLTKSAEQGAH